MLVVWTVVWTLSARCAWETFQEGRDFQSGHPANGSGLRVGRCKAMLEAMIVVVSAQSEVCKMCIVVEVHSMRREDKRENSIFQAR